MDNTYTSRLINIAGLVKTKVKSLVAFFVLFLLLGTSTYAQQNRTVSPAGNKGSISINAGQDGKGLLTKVDSYDNGIDDMLKKYDKQIYFTQNKGQWPSHIRYKADFKFGQAIVTDKGMMVGAFDPTSLLASYAQGNRAEKAQHDGLPFNEAPVKIKGHGWVMNFAGASPSMRITNKNEHPDKFNYFYGNGFSGTDVSSYDEIWYNNVYNNIDVRYYPSAEGTLEYDVIVKPGANPSAIAINFDGIDKLELTREGHLVLNTSVGAMDLPEPYAYQLINGKEVKVDAAYALNDKNQLTFTLGKYDTSKPLIIDPIALRWATWVNSNSTGDNHGHGIWVDPSGNIYMVARVDGSTNLITSGAFDTSANGGVDIIVGKYTEPATVGGAGVRVWQTYIGGSNSDNPYVTEMGPDGNLYMSGQTGSTDFPVTGGTGFTGTPINHQSQTGDDIFVLKINPAGNSIKSAVIGGNGTDNSFDLRIATNGDVIVGGFTTSTNLLTQYSGSGATNSNAGGNDALLFRINQNLDAVSWVRNFGGSGADQINILVNNPTTGDIFVGGNTASTSGITAGTPRQSTLTGASTAFLRRYNSAGTVQWGSYFNSAASGTTSLLCMEFNTTRDRLYFAGITTGLGTNNTPSGTYDNSVSGTNDFYIAHMNIDQTFYASTYIGSTGAENNLMGLNVDDNNDVYLFGYVGNDGYPTAGNPLQSTRAGSTDKVFSKINSVLSTLQYSTYYGGANQEEDPVGQRGIKFSNCRIYTIVTAESNDIPLTNGAVTTTKSSSATDIYEPGIVEWANPPDLNNNTIGPNQNICVGGTPALLDGQTPNYVLPTIIRNGTTSAHPTLTSGISYQWQSSPDNTTWTNIVGATGEDLTPAQMGALTQTTYYRRVFNGDACVVSPQSNVKVGVFTISAAVVNNTCFGGTAGTITLTPTDGTAGYQYSLNGGAFQSGNVFSGLAAGTYTVNAKDALNCTATVTVTITQGSEITGNITTTNASCQAVCNGTATVSGVTGGTGPYTYTWLSGGTGATKTGLCAGTNFVVITDAAGCKDTIDFSINTNPPTQISITVNNVYCAGDNSGSATVNILSGTGPYTYLWSNGQTTQTATGLTVGTYTVTVTDANGCSVSSNAIVQEYSNLVALVSTTEANGGNNGTASVSVFGGTSPYTYLWSNGATTPSISGLATGNYSVTVTDAAGNTVTQIFSITTINDIAAGSFIINMGVTPQTFANGLKPYGLIYDLTRNQNVPVKWVIKTSKAKDAADFTINGTDFKSGAFVIEAKYRTPAVNAVISNWVSQGVVGITTTAAVTLPVYKTITTFSNVVVDQQNEGLVLPYFANAGLPTSMYTVGLPSNLDGCDDAYVILTQTQHGLPIATF